VVKKCKQITFTLKIIFLSLRTVPFSQGFKFRSFRNNFELFSHDWC